MSKPRTAWLLLPGNKKSFGRSQYGLMWRSLTDIAPCQNNKGSRFGFSCTQNNKVFKSMSVQC